jgi:hypothetical protein
MQAKTPTALKYGSRRRLLKAIYLGTWVCNAGWLLVLNSISADGEFLLWWFAISAIVIELVKTAILYALGLPLVVGLAGMTLKFSKDAYDEFIHFEREADRITSAGQFAGLLVKILFLLLLIGLISRLVTPLFTKLLDFVLNLTGSF